MTIQRPSSWTISRNCTNIQNFIVQKYITRPLIIWLEDRDDNQHNHHQWWFIIILSDDLSSSSSLIFSSIVPGIYPLSKGSDWIQDSQLCQRKPSDLPFLKIVIFPVALQSFLLEISHLCISFIPLLQCIAFPDQEILRKKNRSFWKPWFDDDNDIQLVAAGSKIEILFIVLQRGILDIVWFSWYQWRCYCPIFTLSK